jgi:hypothetical protein
MGGNPMLHAVPLHAAVTDDVPAATPVTRPVVSPTVAAAGWLLLKRIGAPVMSVPLESNTSAANCDVPAGAIVVDVALPPDTYT